MKESVSPREKIQLSIARLIATSPAGQGLSLVGGFRYRLLDRSARSSKDVAYHWGGDLAAKAESLATLFRGKLLPEIRSRLGLEGSVRRASVGADDLEAACTVDLAFYRTDIAGSRLEIPVDVIRIPCEDPPCVRTVGGMVYLTVSDADMVESKTLALLDRVFVQARDFVDIFFFQDAFLVDSGVRIRRKLARLWGKAATPEDGLEELRKNTGTHARSMDRLIDEQVDPVSADHLRQVGGGRRVCEAVIETLEKILARGSEDCAAEDCAASTGSP
jgi:hypothetical protein